MRVIMDRALKCPNCNGLVMRRSKRRGRLEWLLSVLQMYPYRCEICHRRFLALASLITVNRWME